jgi:NADH dehydrogenase
MQIVEYPFAFAVGDASIVADNPYPMLAQVATQQGTLAAENILRSLRHEPLKRFTFRERGYLVSVGQKYAVGRVLGIPIKGFLAWFIMRTVYLAKFQSAKASWRAMCEYTRRLFTRK